MRTLGWVLTLSLAGACWGQAVKVEGRKALGNTPTPADMYCAGFIASEHVPTDRFVAAGWNSPDQTRFAAPIDYLYIHGHDIKEGDRFEIVRKARDLNHYESYPGQKGAISSAGEPYFEMGYVRVIDVQKNTAVAVPELACADFVVGDVAIPFVERQAPVFREVTLNRFAPPNGKTVGRIIMGNEFDTMLGTKNTAYIDIGENKGLKVGDYLRATRTYSYTYHDSEGGLSLKASANEDTQKDPQKLPPGDVSSLPRRTLGDMIVLQVHPKSSTVMILTALEDIHVGDGVELMDVASAPEVQPLKPASLETPPGTASGAPMGAASNAAAAPPQIACSASPSTVRPGDSSTITCQASSPDSRPITITFVSNGGKLSSSRNQARLDTAESGPGPIAVRAVAYDDRQLSATAVTTVNVEAPPAAAPTAQKMLSLDFKPNSAYVDNRSKAILDDVALKLQQDPTSTALLSGSAEPSESGKLAGQRADNAKTYLTKSKGIDGQRLQTKNSDAPGRSVDIWTIPQGAAAPK
jgi:outer membrane protein OmpA-like peptidoglycan-associated protein